MPTENITAGIACMLGGALIIAVCLPLFKGQIRPNALYGIRVAKSFESDANWFKMNRYGARQMVRWAGVLIAFGLITFFLPLHGNKNLVTAIGVVPALLMLIPAFQIYRYSKTL